MKIFILSLIFIFSMLFSLAQNNQHAKLKVFIECNFCDQNYIRSEITFVEFINDRAAADVQLVITYRNGDAGSRLFNFQFIGQKIFKNQLHDMMYNQPVNTTDAERKIQIAKRIRIGLLPYTKPPSAQLISKDTVMPADKNVLINAPDINIPEPQKQSEKLKVYLDCKIDCDDNYIRSDLSFVDFVRDRFAADVHVLITSQKTGSGGDHVQMIFFGQKNAKNLTDTIIADQSPNATSVEKRSQIANRLRYGLIPFITKIPNVVLFEITKGILTNTNGDTVVNPLTNVAQQRTYDKWNYWVFRLGADGTYSVDQNYKSSSVSTTLAANRTTNNLRVNFSLSNENNTSLYKYENNGVITNYKVINKNYQVNHTLITSLGKRLSFMYDLRFSSNTFTNNKNRLYAGTGIEYAIFPYSLSNTKFFTISYNADVRHNNYFDTTIFNKTSEYLFGHKAQANFSLKQKWGDMNAAIVYRAYFNNGALNNLSANMSINLRITGGLFFYIYTSGELIHDQVYLLKGNATLQEILTRRRQLASEYSFYSGAGISYRFGSILNNFVNPRFSR